MRAHLFPSRGHAIQEALEEKLDRLQHRRLARECAKLDPAVERAFAEEGMRQDTASWPEYD